MDFIASSTIIIASASIVNYYCKEAQNDILIYKNIQSYTKHGNSCRIQNMATHALYKIWKLVPYRKYGNSCPIKNMATHAKMPHRGKCT